MINDKMHDTTWNDKCIEFISHDTVLGESNSLNAVKDFGMMQNIHQNWKNTFRPPEL
jgi:hypothetical protein